MNDLMKVVVLVAGIIFILAGLTIAISENPTYEPIITPIYILVVYSFYGFLVYLFLSILIRGLESLLKSKFGQKL